MESSVRFPRSGAASDALGQIGPTRLGGLLASLFLCDGFSMTSAPSASLPADHPAPPASDLAAVIGRLLRAARRADRVSVGDLVDAMGQASMAAVLLVPALLLVSPLSGIPGASITGGLVIALISGQMLLRRPKVWLPEAVRTRTLPGPALRRALVRLRRPARGLDRIAPARPGGGGQAWWSPVLALACLILGLAMPMMELVPFGSSILAALVAALALTLLTGRVRIAVAAGTLAAVGVGTAVWAI